MDHLGLPSVKTAIDRLDYAWQLLPYGTVEQSSHVSCSVESLDQSIGKLALVESNLMVISDDSMIVAALYVVKCQDGDTEEMLFDVRDLVIF